MVTIAPLEPSDIAGHLDEFVELLQDAVLGGASVGFLPPLSREEAEAYWRHTAAAMSGGTRHLLAANVDGRIAGSVQLGLPTFPNARHRAEIQKLLVLRSHQQRGIGSALMRAIEQKALELERPLVVLDTLEGSDAERLYEHWGYRRAGVIPRFARGDDGELHATVVFYRWLSS